MKPLDRKAARRERIRLAQHAERMAAIASSTSERMRAKARLREEYLDQVTLDKEQGREIARIARALYRKERQEAKPMPPARSRRRHRQWPGPRPADTYRALRAKLVRGKSMATALKAARKRTGASRPAMGRRRRVLAIEGREAHP